MIAKGHDFPEVTLVGVISADVGLGLADFRAAERTFQLLTQVSGRAGRGERPGQAIIQSLVPEHYSIRLATRQDYRAFYEKEVEYRRTMRYPPQVAMVNVVVRGRTFGEAIDGAREFADAARGGKGYVILGPAPAPLTKLRGEHRAQFFLKGTSRKAMREALQLALARKPELSRRLVGGCRSAVDAVADASRRAEARFATQRAREAHFVRMRCPTKPEGPRLRAPQAAPTSQRRHGRERRYLPTKAPIGAGVKHTSSISNATPARINRPRSSGSCSSKVGG